MLDSEFYIDTTPALRQLASALSLADRIAIDTEADSLHHYFEKVCLIQISADGRDVIVDPLADLDLTPLLKVLRDKPLFLHGADYDLRMLHRSHRFVPKYIFDTATAAQLLGYKQIGLAALVEHHFGVQLSKGKQKADWSRRPLTPDLIQYATNDTKYLLQLASKLQLELEEKGRHTWHDEMCKASIRAAVAERVPIDADREWRIKGWQSLKSRHAQAILRNLWHWRDTEARRTNVPSFKIVSNDTLVSVAAWADQSDDYATAPRLPRNCVGRRLVAMKQAITAAKKLPESEWPRPLNSNKTRVMPASTAIYSKVRRIRDDVAHSLDLEPSLIAPAAALGAISRLQPQSHDELKAVGDLYGWQTDLLAETVLPLFASSNAAENRRSTPQEELNDNNTSPAC